MQHLKDYISDSILSSVGAGKTAVIKKIVSDKDFTLQNIALLEKSVSVWKPKDKPELIYIINAYIKSAGPDCSLNWIDVSNIKDLSNLFSNIEFEGDISKWDTHNVTDMGSMFQYSRFNGDISKWDTSSVTNMSYMFSDSNFNGDISNWNVQNVKYMDNMFYNSKFDRDISKWDVSNVKEKRYIFAGSKIQAKYKPLLK